MGLVAQEPATQLLVQQSLFDPQLPLARWQQASELELQDDVPQQTVSGRHDPPFGVHPEEPVLVPVPLPVEPVLLVPPPVPPPVVAVAEAHCPCSAQFAIATRPLSPCRLEQERELSQVNKAVGFPHPASCPQWASHCASVIPALPASHSS